VRSEFSDHPLFRGATLASALPTPVADGSMDMVISVEMVEHLFDEHLGATFKEFHRLLRPGGTLIVTTPNEENLAASRVLCPDCGGLFHQYQHVRTWSSTSLRQALQAHGFETITCHATLIAPKPAADGLRAFFRRLRKLPKPSQPHLIYVGRRIAS
jgi:SAM-dependent methyltransferase